jgi:hypothetical protein
MSSDASLKNILDEIYNMALQKKEDKKKGLKVKSMQKLSESESGPGCLPTCHSALPQL